MAETEITQRAAFDRIRYAQVWEDADILVEALRLKPSDTVVSIASAGDNALALLAEGVERVIAVDMNPTQLACLRLRVELYKRMHWSDLVELMGSRPSQRRGAILAEAARTLPDEDQKFWAGQKHAIEKWGLGGVGKFEGYFRLFREWVLPFVHNNDTIVELLQHKAKEDRQLFYDKRWNIWGWRMLLKVFFSKSLMGRLGRDPAFFDHVPGGSLPDQVARLTRRALVDQDPSRNPYLHWILRGVHAKALPRALDEDRYDTIRARLPHLEIRQCTVETLADEGVKADAFNLSDIFEYMSPEGHEIAYGSVLAAAAGGARIAYWNMMAPRRAPAAFADRVKPNTELSERLKPLDKAFFYSDFVIEDVV